MLDSTVINFIYTTEFCLLPPEAGRESVKPTRGAEAGPRIHGTSGKRMAPQPTEPVATLSLLCFPHFNLKVAPATYT